MGRRSNADIADELDWVTSHAKAAAEYIAANPNTQFTEAYIALGKSYEDEQRAILS